MQSQGFLPDRASLDPPRRRAIVDLARPLAVAEDALARLDERLAKSPIAEAFFARSHVLDAAAGISAEGELVTIEDLVLHDAAADARSPTHALTRAHAALRTRRRLAAAAPGWALTAPGLDTLRGLEPNQSATQAADAIAEEEDAFAAELAKVDALIARSSLVLEGSRDGWPGPQHVETPPELDNSAGTPRENALAAWRATLAESEHEPPVAAAALAGLSFDTLAPLPNQAWLGRLLVADLLRARNKTRHHLAALNLGMKLATRDRRWRRDHESRLALWIAAITQAAQTGLADHDRWLTARHVLERKLAGRRSTSHLPALVDLVLRSPVVSAATIAAELRITPRAAQNLVAELGLRELTGRGRYRCWGVL